MGTHGLSRHPPDAGLAEAEIAAFDGFWQCQVGEKRLAVRTEDFEGNIPKGEYGGGSMIVWDRGRWLPEGDPHKGLTKGHLAFSLEGTRLKHRHHRYYY